MNNESLIEILKRETPSHFNDIVASLELVREQLNYTKVLIEKKTQIEMNQNNYQSVKEYVDVAESLYKKIEEIDIFILENMNEEEIVVEDEIEEIQGTNNQLVDYDSYKVDETIAYDLFSNITYKKPAAIWYKGNKYNVSTWKGMLIHVCTLLCKENLDKFKSFANDVSMQGKKKARFTYDAKELRKGKEINNLGIFVETNLSANDIRNIIISMLEKYEISTDAIKIYLSKDFTELHKD